METGSAIRAGDADASIVLHERAIGAIDPVEWDRFAAASDGSFLGSWNVIRAERIRHTVRVFEFLSRATPPAKLGQCAVAIAGRSVRFLDRIHLLPAHASAWEQCLREVIARCGARRCTYGSAWNHEARAVAGTRSRSAASPTAGSVSIASTSSNGATSRPIAAPSARTCDAITGRRPRPRQSSPRGAAWMRAATCPRSSGLRRQVMRRNNEPFSSMVDAPVHALKLMCLGDDAFISVVEANGRAQAAFFGVRFGGAFYYVSGGTADKCEGFGSYLLLTLIERWFAEQPRGKLYLGVTEPGYVPATYMRGNLLYRRKLRAVSVPGTSFTLDVG